MAFNRIIAILFAFLIVSSLSFSASCSDSVPTEINSARVAEKMLAKSFTTSTGDTLNYRLYRSPGCGSPNTNKPAILIVYFHNESGKGSDNTAHLAERGPLNQLISDSADRMFSEFPYIVVAPQCPEGKSFLDSDVIGTVKELKEEIASKESLTRRCIVMGAGTGAEGALEYASRYTNDVTRLLAIGGSPDKLKAFGSLSSGVTMMYFAEKDNAAVKGFCDYAESMGEYVYITTIFTDGGFDKSVNAALDYNEPSITGWVVKDAYESITFNISVRCTDGAAKISASPDKVRCGGSSKVVITVNKGYAIERVLVNGGDIDINKLEQSDNNKNQYIYNLNGVTADCSMMVELVAIPVSGEKEELIQGLITSLTVISVVLVLGAGVVFALSSLKKYKA